MSSIYICLAPAVMRVFPAADAQASGGRGMDDPKTLTEEEWRKRLTPEQYYVCRQRGTEQVSSHPTWPHPRVVCLYPKCSHLKCLHIYVFTLLLSTALCSHTQWAMCSHTISSLCVHTWHSHTEHKASSHSTCLPYPLCVLSAS